MHHRLATSTSNHLAEQWSAYQQVFSAQTLETAKLVSLILGEPVTNGAALLERLTGNPLSALRTLTADELEPQFGVVSSARLLAALELARRLYASPLPSLPMLDDPETVAALMEHHIAHNDVEQFIVLSLDVKMRLIGLNVIAVGTQTECAITPRDVFRTVLRRGGVAAIVGHNHPSGLNGSGSLEPSPEDMALTKSLLRAGKSLDIKLLDHLIVAGKGWNSLRQSTSLWVEITGEFYNDD